MSTSTKSHYDNLLGNIYSWMVGDFETKESEFQQILLQQNIAPISTSKIAIDFGAGQGIQSVALAKAGFNVKAVDFNKQLLAELQINSKDLPVEVIEDDIRDVTKKYKYLQPELIICWGDTLTHLDSKTEIENFITECAEALSTGNGKLLLAFRDYSVALQGNARFIPVKSDNDKILTAFLEYDDDFVTVTDMLHEKKEAGWQLKISSYKKVRVLPEEVVTMIEKTGLNIRFCEPYNRFFTIIAEKN